MKPFSISSYRRAWIRTKAFTLPEMMISMTIMMTVILGMTYAQITGLKMYELTKAKLGVNDMTRDSINSLTLELRAAKSVKVGNGDLSSFTEITNGFLQGNAIQLYSNTNTTQYIRYYLDVATSASNKLLRTTNSSTYKEVIADYITNRNIFTLEDYMGNTLSNSQSTPVVSMLLSFYQVQYPIITFGTPGAYFDYYRLSLKVTPR